MYALIYALMPSSMALASMSGAVQPSAGDPVTDPEAYAVYAAVVPNQWPVRVAKARLQGRLRASRYVVEAA